MTDLTTWLRAQLDGREACAREMELLAGAHDDDTVFGATVDGGRFTYRPWDPARFLAEVEAKRRILDWAVRALKVTEEDSYNLGCDDVLRLLALPYADQEGYRDEWRP